jgi:glycosyltransferase involved in cell wall biosynthesis
VLAIEDPDDSFSYPFPVRRTIQKEDLGSVLAAAEWIGASGADVVSIQHEFGIWGGFDGQFLLPFLDALRVPVHLTLHVVPIGETGFNRVNRLRLLREILPRVDRVATFIPAARDYLVEACGAEAARVEAIWHGAPLPPTVDRAAAKAELGLSDRTVVSTFGLLSRFKGLADAIDAFAAAAAEHPEAVYLVLGQPHPYEPADLLPNLRARAERLGVADQVRFESRFLAEDEVGRYLAATDVYLTPYVEPTQISSGTLSRAMAAGCAVLSTPYLYAEAALADDRGVVSPFGDTAALGRNLAKLLESPAQRETYGARARAFAETLAWPRVAADFLASCRAAIETTRR